MSEKEQIKNLQEIVVRISKELEDMEKKEAHHHLIMVELRSIRGRLGELDDAHLAIELLEAGQ